MVNWPNPPFATNDKHSGAVSWFTRFVQAAKANAITNVVATGGGRAKLKQNTSGQTLEINFPGGGTPPDFFYPFKIYQPKFKSLSNSGTTFDANGNPQAIDPLISINPATDMWKVWAVRDGLVSTRSYFNICFDDQFILPGIALTTTQSDFSVQFEVDLDNATSFGGFDLDPNQDPFFEIDPIILPDSPGTSGVYSYALWLEIDREALTATLKCRAFDWSSGFQFAFPNQDDSTQIPIAVITSLGDAFYSTGDPQRLTVYQMQFGHVPPRFGAFINNQGNSNSEGFLMLSAGLNYRGDFLNDDALDNLVFYPGDVVKIQREIDLSATSQSTVHSPGIGTVTTTTTVKAADASGSEGNSSKLFAQSLYMMTTVGFTNDPTTDQNWVKISGLDVANQNHSTPNT